MNTKSFTKSLIVALAMSMIAILSAMFSMVVLWFIIPLVLSIGVLGLIISFAFDDNLSLEQRNEALLKDNEQLMNALKEMRDYDAQKREEVKTLEVQPQSKHSDE
jgi:uncharacterized membrane protein YqiK